MNNVYGAVHPDMVQCMRLLGRLSYVFSDTAEALNQQHKATLISERCNGLDHAQTIMEYVSPLPLYESILDSHGTFHVRESRYCGFIEAALSSAILVANSLWRKPPDHGSNRCKFFSSYSSFLLGEYWRDSLHCSGLR